MNILIDTHVFLWLTLGDKRLSQRALHQFKQADIVFMSSISAWEITTKYHRGRLPLPEPPELFVRKCSNELGIKLLAFEERDTHPVGKLPLIHKDPFDRMLICQAISRSLPLLTNDEAIRQYPIKTIW